LLILNILKKFVDEILRLAEISPRRLQIVISPRQVGKTTAGQQAGFPTKSIRWHKVYEK
jgi:predicted AAA+ superfamily ATPase